MRRPRRRRPWRWVLVAGLVAATAGHLAFWYSPREREGTPEVTGREAALLADLSYPLRLWIPYPHQNLGALAAEVGDLDAWIAAASRLAGTQPPRLPRFGPFPFPPGSALVVAADPGAARLAVVLHAYPTVAALARAAGAVARNPWLGGGAVEVGGRPAQVAWVGVRWTLTVGAPPEAVADGTSDPIPSLGRFVAGSAAGWLPAGAYRIERVEDGLWLAETAPPAGLRARLQRFSAPGLALAVTEGALGGGARALAVWAPKGASGEAAIPAIASLARAPSERWRLPGESFLALAGRRPPSRERDGWTATAFESSVAERAAGIAGTLGEARDALLPAAGGRLVWANPARLAAAAGGLADLLGQIPLFGPSESGRWRDLQAVLSPLADCQEVAAVLPAASPSRFAGAVAEPGMGAPAALLLCGSAPPR